MLSFLLELIEGYLFFLAFVASGQMSSHLSLTEILSFKRCTRSSFFQNSDFLFGLTNRENMMHLSEDSLLKMPKSFQDEESERQRRRD